jgi:hypothetical protein
MRQRTASLYYDISVDYKNGRMRLNTDNTRLDQHTKDLSRNINKKLKDNTRNMGALKNDGRPG